MNDWTLFESQAQQLGYRHIVGIDEAGRGPLAGPVVAAACFIPADQSIEGINDSKKLTAAEREKMYEVLSTTPGVEYGLGIVDSIQIDEINILQATLMAMNLAIENLATPPDYLLVDGLHLPRKDKAGLPLVEGDRKSRCIAAASIFAKVTRDRLMEQFHYQWPDYGFIRHKGYATAEHLKAIRLHGPCPIHRMSFEPLKSLITPVQLPLF